MTASLYIHVPFCVKKCAYCDFYSCPAQNDRIITDYLRALRCELDSWAPLTVQTVFLGGGTPSSLSVEHLEELLSMIRDTIEPDAVTEWSCEVNPGTMTANKAALMVQAGINRVSIGAQSMRDGVLQALGRIHTVRDTLETIDVFTTCGLDNFNLDLMYGLPGESLEECRSDVTAMLKLQPAHVATYALSVEQGTPLERSINTGHCARPDDDITRDQYDMLRQELGDNGYEHYELSNFSLPDRACRHNVTYWQNGQWLGCGPAACSHWKGHRWGNMRDLPRWSACVQNGSSPRIDEEIDTPEQFARDTLMLGLRLMEGLSYDVFREKTGISLKTLCGEGLSQMIALGMITANPDGIRLAPEAYFISNAVIAELL
ncbi:MAG: radical SAM family heme chaperone HemW [Spartobacteria bacterium]|nr:radical SAM family heme chaperone HemW [Spartobacteria bacterium]